MSLTKKEFMMAVKLCSDVAVQRGLPNMRLRAAKNFHSKGKNTGLNWFEQVSEQMFSCGGRCLEILKSLKHVKVISLS